jgi:hypothetical protein
MAHRVPIDWEAYQAGKKTGLSLGYIEGLKVGIRAIAEMKLGSADAQFLEEIADMNDPGFLEWLLQRLKGASSFREIRALYTPPEELDDPAPSQPH